MKKTIQTKRNTSSGSNYRVLYAKTGRKRRIHAATAVADPHVALESDVPNVGIGRALLVILVLHVVAIGAIYVHSTFFGNDRSASTDSSGKAPVAAAIAAAPETEAPIPKRVVKPATPVTPVAPVTAAIVEDPASERYIVVTGDSYNRISQVRNVDEQALRALNNNRPLRAGVVLDLPAELSSRPVAVNNTPAHKPAVAVVNGDQLPAESNFRATETASEPDVSNAPKAVVIEPKLVRPVSTVKDSGTRYKIKSGDTLWRLSSRYKVSRQAILELNNIKDPNKLYAGREIKIPAK